jgi:hypothetical protein
MAPTVFTISDLRAGINNSDSPTLLPQNQIMDARNVDFREGALGAKRRGTEGIDITGASFDSGIVAVFRHTPTNAIANDELWAIDENGNIDRRVGGTWAGSIATVNDLVVVNSGNFSANAVSLHGKLFIAARGTYDRLLVWDGTVLRWAGFWQAQDPTVADTGVGSFTGTRYYRIRYVERNVFDVVVRRSEASNVVSLAPSGAGSGALITKPAGTELSSSIYSEGQTHWEVEASIDNILFYRIATVDIATSTYTDTTAYSTGYSSNTLSETTGEYVPPTCPRHLAVDEDRVVGAGNFFDLDLDSEVWWTPVASDDGVGNDERVPTETSQFINFDGLDGGRVTALVAGVAGNVYVFKHTRVHKMVRTGVASAAYNPVAESFSRGSTLRGATSGVDQFGVPCAYFLDPSVGLCRIGQRGVEDLAHQIRDTWRGRNPDAAIGPRIIYYPELDQVWFTSPTQDPEFLFTFDGDPILTSDGENILVAQTVPELMVIYEVRYNGLMFHSGVPGTAQALCLFYNDSSVLKPVIAGQLADIGGGNESYFHFGDTGTTDSGTAFQAYVKTKPYMLGDLWTKFGIMAGAMLAKAASGTSILLSMLRNFSIETNTATVSLTPVGAESHVVKPIDNATMSELSTIQFQYGDSAASAQEWSIDQLTFKVRVEDQMAG